MILRTNSFGVLVGLVLGLIATSNCWAEEDKTLSPYFFVSNSDTEVDSLPLESTEADVQIAGVIADVKVTQIYKNQGTKPLEATYVFPASTRAAVYGMKMTIGERTIVADIKRRDEARKTYEDAKAAGKSASLLEQQRPNVFQMNVANIMPGDRIRVELRYTELIVPEEGVYSFVYPTVVGPRYSETPANSTDSSETWVKNPYLKAGEVAPFKTNITARLRTGLALQQVTSSSHKIDIQFEDATSALVTLKASETNPGNRDYVLDYRLSGGAIESGLLLYEGKTENFFLSMIQPPKRVRTNEIPAREYIFIVDISGSMHGFPLDTSKTLLRNLIGNLRPTDSFNVLLFAGSTALLSESSLPATRENIAKAIQHIENQRGGGGTRLLPALQRALALPKTKHSSRSLVIATDGYVSVETEAFDYIKNHLGDANFFSFGIGSSVNRHLIEGIARIGHGEPFIITAPEKASSQAERFRKYIETPVLSEIKATYEGFNVYDVEPLSIPDVLAERPILIFGKWRGRPSGSITLTGQTGAGAYRGTIDVSKSTPTEANAALRYLWARHRIRELADYNQLSQDEKRKAEITELGLTYSLLTDYTSFVAVDSEVRNTSGENVSVKQPLPLPQGVSNYAVGGVAAGYTTGGLRRKQLLSAPLTLQKEKRSSNAALESKAPRQDSALEEADAPEPPVTADKLQKNEIRTISTQGALSQAEVRSTVLPKLSELEKCISGKNDAEKRLLFRIVVGADGRVKSVSTLMSELSDSKALACITETLTGLVFPAGAYSGETTITLPLRFDVNSKLHLES